MRKEARGTQDAGVRSVKDIKDIAEFLNQMTFRKKIFGGCDQEDVLDQIETITLMYQKLLTDMNAKMAASVQTASTAGAEIEAARNETAAVRSELESLKVIHQQDEAQILSLKNELTAMTNTQNEFDEKTRLLTESMLRQERERGEIKAWAEKEAQVILLKAEKDAQELVEKKQKELDRQIDDQKAQLAMIKKECELVRREQDRDKRKVIGNLTDVRKDLEVFITDVEQLFEDLHDTIGGELYSLTPAESVGRGSLAL